MNRYIKNIIALAFVVALVAFLTRSSPWSMMNNPTKTVSYSEARRLIVEGKIARGTMTNDDFSFEAKKGGKYQTTLPPQDTKSGFADWASGYKVNVKVGSSLFSNQVVSMLLSVALFCPHISWMQASCAAVAWS